MQRFCTSDMWGKRQYYNCLVSTVTIYFCPGYAKNGSLDIASWSVSVLYLTNIQSIDVNNKHSSRRCYSPSEPRSMRVVMIYFPNMRCIQNTLPKVIEDFIYAQRFSTKLFGALPGLKSFMFNHIQIEMRVERHHMCVKYGPGEIKILQTIDDYQSLRVIFYLMKCSICALWSKVF